VSGWIRNGDDGSSVTGQAIGDQSSVGSLCVYLRERMQVRDSGLMEVNSVKDLHDGPKPAKVESVELGVDEKVESTKDAGVDQEGFEVRK
jgi:acylphosphatase